MNNKVKTIMNHKKSGFYKLTICQTSGIKQEYTLPANVIDILETNFLNGKFNSNSILFLKFGDECLVIPLLNVDKIHWKKEVLKNESKN